MQKQNRAHSEESKKLLEELNKLRSEKEQQQKMLAQSLLLSEDARVEASLKHELMRLTNDNLVAPHLSTLPHILPLIQSTFCLFFKVRLSWNTFYYVNARCSGVKQCRLLQFRYSKYEHLAFQVWYILPPAKSVHNCALKEIMDQKEKQDKTIRKLKKQLKVFVQRMEEFEGELPTNSINTLLSG